MYQESKELMAKVVLTCANGIQIQLRAYFSSSTMRKMPWCNRSDDVNRPIKEDESFSKSTISPNQVSDKLVKTLGVCWDTVSDEMSFDFEELIEYANTLQVTKRSLLKLSAKMFDPLGFLSPFTITMKCEFQSLGRYHKRLWTNFVF